VGQYDPKTPKRINSVSVTMFLVTVALAYGGWFYLPHWWPVFQLSGIMRGICNDAYREFDDKKLMDKLLTQSQRLSMKVAREDFVLYREPYTPQDVHAMNDEARRVLQTRGKVMHAKFKKTVVAKWPLVSKWSYLTFEKEVSTTLETITW